MQPCSAVSAITAWTERYCGLLLPGMDRITGSPWHLLAAPGRRRGSPGACLPPRLASLEQGSLKLFCLG